MKKINLFCMFLGIFVLNFLVSCQFDNNAPDEIYYAQVTFNIEQTRRLPNRQATESGSIGSSLISVVPQQISSVNSSTDLSDAYDRQLLDPANNSVSLSVPLETSIRLVKANYAEEYTRSEIIDTNPIPFAIGVCPPLHRHCRNDGKKSHYTDGPG